MKRHFEREENFAFIKEAQSLELCNPAIRIHYCEKKYQKGDNSPTLASETSEKSGNCLSPISVSHEESLSSSKLTACFQLRGSLSASMESHRLSIEDSLILSKDFSDQKQSSNVLRQILSQIYMWKSKLNSLEKQTLQLILQMNQNILSFKTTWENAYNKFMMKIKEVEDEKDKLKSENNSLIAENHYLKAKNHKYGIKLNQTTNFNKKLIQAISLEKEYIEKLEKQAMINERSEKQSMVSKEVQEKSEKISGYSRNSKEMSMPKKMMPMKRRGSEQILNTHEILSRINKKQSMGDQINLKTQSSLLQLPKPSDEKRRYKSEKGDDQTEKSSNSEMKSNEGQEKIENRIEAMKMRIISMRKQLIGY